MRQTVTWDQGSQKWPATWDHRHHRRPGLLRRPTQPPGNAYNEHQRAAAGFLPKGTDLSIYTREELDKIEDLMNSRPRKALDWLTPIEHLSESRRRHHCCRDRMNPPGRDPATMQHSAISGGGHARARVWRQARSSMGPVRGRAAPRVRGAALPPHLVAVT